MNYIEIINNYNRAISLEKELSELEAIINENDFEFSYQKDEILIDMGIIEAHIKDANINIKALSL